MFSVKLYVDSLRFAGPYGRKIPELREACSEWTRNIAERRCKCDVDIAKESCREDSKSSIYHDEEMHFRDGSVEQDVKAPMQRMGWHG
jgi:hypothetical protein